jgi:hypothetical protein
LTESQKNPVPRQRGEFDGQAAPIDAPAANPAGGRRSRNRCVAAVGALLMMITVHAHADALRASIGHGPGIDLHAVSL